MVFAPTSGCDFDHALFDACLKQKTRLELWARHDATLATSPEVMGRFLKEANPNFLCYLIGSHYHPKVIWWHGYGVYIGSANLRLPRIDGHGVGGKEGRKIHEDPDQETVGRKGAL